MGNNKKGFTLVELLAVMVIISVLLLLALPSVTRQIEQARKRTFAEDAQTIASAVKDDLLIGDKPLNSYDDISKINALLDKKLGKSPFGGTYEVAKAEVSVSHDPVTSKRTFGVRICLVDSNGNGFGYSRVENLDADSIGIGSVSERCTSQNEATSKIEVINKGNPNFINTSDSGSGGSGSGSGDSGSGSGDSGSGGSSGSDNSQIPDDQPISEWRFVGNNIDIDKNYVYFNCSDTSNQNDSTCDLYRIMGIFTVENEYGVYEDRLKLIDVNEIKAPAPNAGKWDVNGSNNWAYSSLKDYLNGSYLSNINEKYRSLIGSTKYYLGGSTKANLTRSKMYDAERKRGNDDSGTYYHPYNEDDTYWIGHVGLMYASDFGYATKNSNCEDVDLADYNTDESLGNGCGNNWVWKLDIEDLQPSPYWLITQVSSTNNDAYYIDNKGMAKSVNVFGSNHPAHPVFYLTSTAEIVGGRGTRSEPYRLFK